MICNLLCNQKKNHSYAISCCNAVQGIYHYAPIQYMYSLHQNAILPRKTPMSSSSIGTRTRPPSPASYRSPLSARRPLPHPASPSQPTCPPTNARRRRPRRRLELGRLPTVHLWPRPIRSSLPTIRLGASPASSTSSALSSFPFTAPLC